MFVRNIGSMRRRWVIAGAAGGILVCVVVVVCVLRGRRPSVTECESSAISFLYRCMVAQAAYSLRDWRGDDVPRFATNVRDLYYTELDGEPIALIKKEIADADSPSKAYKGYYFTSMTRDVNGAIDPCLDFAVCATPVYRDCCRIVCWGREAVYMEDRPTKEMQRTKDTSTPMTTYPDIGKGGWLPIGCEGYVRIEKAGVARGMGWAGKMHEILTLEDFEDFYRRMRSGQLLVY